MLKQLTKRLVERVLEAELTAHLGYAPHVRHGTEEHNSRNGKGQKTVQTATGPLDLVVPHGRNGGFAPQLLDGSTRSVMHWILATFLLCLTCSSRRAAKELGVHIRTSYRWCWWLRNAAVSYEMGRQLAGTVEADDLY